MFFFARICFDGINIDASFSRWPSFLGKRCAYNQQTDLDLHLIGVRCQLFGCGDLQVRTNEHTASMQWIGDILFLVLSQIIFTGKSQVI